jgi:hypothetical protein
MTAFRRETSISALAAAATRAPDHIKAHPRRSGLLRSVPPSLVKAWLKKYRGHAWFARWLLCGNSPPAGVTVATAAQVRGCRAAWDWIEHCARAGVSIDQYYHWFETEDGQPPKLPGLEYLKWLYGGVDPTGVFVVPEALQRLREEMKPDRICAAAGVHLRTWQAWRRDPALRDAVNGITAAVRESASLEPWDQVQHQAKKKMMAYAKAATAKASCQRAHISPAHCYKLVMEADALGLRDELEDYLNCRGRYGGRRGKATGLTAPSFFVPSRAMWKFRRVAEKAVAKQRMFLFDDLPGLDAWVVAWVSPSEEYSRRGRPLPAWLRSDTVSAALDAGHPHPPPTAPKPDKREPGRPDQNREIIAYATALWEREPDLTQKEVLSRFKQERHDHPIFSNKDPHHAFRTALQRARELQSQ